MKIRLTKTVAGPDPSVCGSPGQEIIVTNEKGKLLLEAGAGVLLEENSKRKAVSKKVAETR